MGVTAFLRTQVKGARKRGASWVRLIDMLRLVSSPEGRGRLWTRFVHAKTLHQTTPHTCEDRYPELFDLSARLAPDAKRILSFGCSTGEELSALRRRFPAAAIVGAEINARSRRIAARRVGDDHATIVVPPTALCGRFELIFALAVFQREPMKIEEAGISDLSKIYPFARFNAAVSRLVDLLQPGGFLCVANCHYRIEDTSVAGALDPIAEAPVVLGYFFGPDGKRLTGSLGSSIFRKREQGADLSVA